MSCHIYENCQQISKQLCKISTDLNKILSEVHTASFQCKSQKGDSRETRNVPSRKGYNGDWYLRPLNLSETNPVHPRDSPPNETVSTSNYIPGTVGNIIAEVRKDMEKKNVTQKSESSGNRRKDLCSDYNPEKVFKAQGRDMDAHLEDYVDETDMKNLKACANNLNDQLMENGKSTLGESNDDVASPFYAKLAQLRMEELLLEEKRLLELKRVQELIRTRRPRKLWYMLRTKEFTEELMRNTEMLRNGRYQEEIDKYRTELIKASRRTGKQFQRPITN